MSAVLAESGLFDLINGLPMHPLVVHAAVVLLPVTALLAIVVALVPRWSRSWGLLVPILAFVSTGAAFLAKESGEALARRVGRRPSQRRGTCRSATHCLCSRGCCSSVRRGCGGFSSPPGGRAGRAFAADQNRRWSRDRARAGRAGADGPGRRLRGKGRLGLRRPAVTAASFPPPAADRPAPHCRGGERHPRSPSRAEPDPDLSPPRRARRRNATGC